MYGKATKGTARRRNMEKEPSIHLMTEGAGTLWRRHPR